MWRRGLQLILELNLSPHPLPCPFSNGAKKDPWISIQWVGATWSRQFSLSRLWTQQYLWPREILPIKGLGAVSYAIWILGYPETKMRRENIEYQVWNLQKASRSCFYQPDAVFWLYRGLKLRPFSLSWKQTRPIKELRLSRRTALPNTIWMTSSLWSDSSKHRILESGKGGGRIMGLSGLAPSLWRLWIVTSVWLWYGRPVDCCKGKPWEDWLREVPDPKRQPRFPENFLDYLWKGWELFSPYICEGRKWRGQLVDCKEVLRLETCFPTIVHGSWRPRRVSGNVLGLHTMLVKFYRSGNHLVDHQRRGPLERRFIFILNLCSSIHKAAVDGSLWAFGKLGNLNKDRVKLCLVQYSIHGR